MGRLLESHSKRLLAKSGIPIPRHFVAGTAAEAREKAEILAGEVVLKALVPVGKRGKAGAIKFAANPNIAEEMAGLLLGTVVRHYPVREILIEERLEIEQELFVSCALDKAARRPAVLVSSAGGIDVEEISSSYPERMRILHVDPFKGLEHFRAKELWSDLGLSGSILRQASDILAALYRFFVGYDCTTLEINPLAVTQDGKVVAAASVMAVDDSALYRHRELSDLVQMGSDRAWRPLTALEKQVVEVNESDPYRGTARYTEMDGGDIGFMCGGGGASLMMFDALLACGGRPANYTEVGGNPSEKKVYGLARAILSKSGVRGLIVAGNITNNTQVDVIARGVVGAIKDSDIDPRSFPVLVRYAGVNDAEGRRILAEAGIDSYGEEITLTMAAEKMMEKMTQVRGR